MKGNKRLYGSAFTLIALCAVMTGCKTGTSVASSVGASSAASSEAPASSSVAEPVTPFNGNADYTGISSEDKADILGQMEAYSLKHHLAGIPLYGDGGYTLYSDRCEFPITNPVTNYGTGLLREGNITADMTIANEPDTTLTRYYHRELSKGRDKMNPMDADDTETGAETGYITSVFWNTRLKRDAAGKYLEDYEYYGSYSKDDAPTATDLTDAGTAKTWRFKVRTGTDTVPLKYHTASTATVNGVAINTFDGRGVTVDDYIFAMKILNTQSYGNYYSFQYSSDVGTIAGMTDYYNATEKVGATDATAAAAWDNVGYKKIDDETIEVKFLYPCNQFMAMYRMNNTLIAPFPKDFYETICGTMDSTNFSNDLYGKYNSDKTVTPVDSVLSVGAYTLTKYSTGTGSDNEILFARNDDFPDTVIAKNNGQKIYQIPGIKIKINSAISTDSEANYKDFLAGANDVSGIPFADKDSVPSTIKKVWVPGTTTWKLQVNSCDQEEWVKLFGKDGTVSPTANEADYYQCKPIMHNDDFINGVYTAIDRQTIAKNLNNEVSCNFFSDAYEIDPIVHTKYNDTDAHKKATADYYTDTYSYNLEASKQLFSDAIDQLLADKAYTAGTSDNPTVIEVQFAYQQESQFAEEGEAEKKYVEDAFNAVGLAKGVKLQVNLYAPANWYDVYYSMTMVGQFDFCFAAISGGTLDPFNFMYTLRSDNISTMTLSWNCDTNTCDGDIVYKNHSFSFDAIYNAVEYGDETIKDGCLVNA
jgi:hypothetical protein